MSDILLPLPRFVQELSALQNGDVFFTVLRVPSLLEPGTSHCFMASYCREEGEYVLRVCHGDEEPWIGIGASAEAALADAQPQIEAWNRRQAETPI